jgi:hypothetical protein
VDVVEWSRALDVKLSEWCCSVSMVWVQIPSREEQKFDSMQKYSFIEHVMLEYICTYLFDSIGQISSSEINLLKSSCTIHNLKC